MAACLEKDPDQRWQSCRDVSRELSWLDLNPHTTDGRPTAASVGARWLPWTVAVAATVGVIGMLPGWLTTRRPAPPSTLQLSLLPPPQTSFSSPPASIVSPQLALSPDGRQLAVVAEERGSRPMLWIRALDGGDVRALRGTEDATYPFWSPDSRAVGFFAQGKLKTVDVAGGVPRTLADAALDSRGGTWGAAGVILFAPERGGLLQIPAAGGTPSPATTLDETRQDTTHRFPSFLPDGRHFLYSVRTRKSGEEGLGVAVGSLDSRETRVVISRTAWGAHYAEPGYILFLRAGTLMAQPFNRETLVASGDAVAIAQDVGATTTGYSSFSAASTGMLVHARPLSAPGRLRWFTRDGVPGDGLWDEGEYLDLALAPDERTLAVSRVGDAGLTSADLWLLDLVRGVPTRFTTHPMNDASPVWAPDGARLVFRSNREGYTQLYERRSAGTDAERTVLNTGISLIPTDWSADGRTVIYTSTTSPTGYEIWSWPAGSDQAPQRIVRTGLNATHGRLSPDGRWLAYASDESGSLQVWVQPLPATGEKRQISPDGGSEPQWRRDGAELFYLSSRGQLMSVAMPGGNAFAAGAPRPLFSVDVPLAGNPFRSNYAVTKDGQRFLINTRSSAASASISVVTNWTTLLRTASAE
nr:Protein TolB [uncultured bacterium]